MKRFLSITITFAVLSSSLFSAGITAKAIAAEAARKENVDEAVEYVQEQISLLENGSEKRSALIYLASIQEQLAFYNEAQKSYAAAAGISAPDAEGMPKKNNQQLVLDAVRCSLCAGDWQTADSYLNSSVRNSKNETIQAYIKLYSQWSALSRAESSADLQEPLLMLQTYSKLDSMKSVRPAIYLTLWYVTGDNAYGKEITTQFPASVEAAIVNGDIQLLPTPFWFFVPKSGEAEQGTGTFVNGNSSATSDSPKVTESKDKAPVKTENTVTKLQLGLFRTESNAKLLSEEVKAKGFGAYVISETRASGTTYYLVLVNDNENGAVAERLRSSGYECYAVE